MRRPAHAFIGSLLTAFFLFYAGPLLAEVITIDFNKGTTSGTLINTVVDVEVPRTAYCQAGSDLFTLHSATQYSYYSSSGCGIRLSSKTKTGYIILSLDGQKDIAKVVVYASKVAGNANSSLTVYAAASTKYGTTRYSYGSDGTLERVDYSDGTYTRYAYDNTERVAQATDGDLTAYSASNAASECYALPEVAVNRTFRDLKLKAPGGGYVMIHRLDIYIGNGADDDDAVRAPQAPPDDGNVLYNLLGQRISRPSRGIFVRGGKKCLQK